MQLSDITKSQDTDGKEKHVPGINVVECSSIGELTVEIQVGKDVIHPSTTEHFIRWINLFGKTREGKTVLIANFNLEGQYSMPRVKVNIKKETYSELLAVIYCNLHGVWENSIKRAL